MLNRQQWLEGLYDNIMVDDSIPPGLRTLLADRKNAFVDAIYANPAVQDHNNNQVFDLITALDNLEVDNLDDAGALIERMRLLGLDARFPNQKFLWAEKQYYRVMNDPNIVFFGSKLQEQLANRKNNFIEALVNNNDMTLSSQGVTDLISAFQRATATADAVSNEMMISLGLEPTDGNKAAFWGEAQYYRLFDIEDPVQSAFFELDQNNQGAANALKEYFTLNFHSVAEVNNFLFDATQSLEDIKVRIGAAAGVRSFQTDHIATACFATAQYNRLANYPNEAALQAAFSNLEPQGKRIALKDYLSLIYENAQQIDEGWFDSRQNKQNLQTLFDRATGGRTDATDAIAEACFGKVQYDRLIASDAGLREAFAELSNEERDRLKAQIAAQENVDAISRLLSVPDNHAAFKATLVDARGLYRIAEDRAEKVAKACFATTQYNRLVATGAGLREAFAELSNEERDRLKKHFAAQGNAAAVNNLLATSDPIAFQVTLAAEPYSIAADRVERVARACFANTQYQRLSADAGLGAAFAQLNYDERDRLKAHFATLDNVAAVDNLLVTSDPIAFRATLEDDPYRIGADRTEAVARASFAITQYNRLSADAGLQAAFGGLSDVERGRLKARFATQNNADAVNGQLFTTALTKDELRNRMGVLAGGGGQTGTTDKLADDCFAKAQYDSILQVAQARARLPGGNDGLVQALTDPAAIPKIKKVLAGRESSVDVKELVDKIYKAITSTDLKNAMRALGLDEGNNENIAKLLERNRAAAAHNISVRGVSEYVSPTGGALIAQVRKNLEIPKFAQPGIFGLKKAAAHPSYADKYDRILQSADRKLSDIETSRHMDDSTQLELTRMDDTLCKMRNDLLEYQTYLTHIQEGSENADTFLHQGYQQDRKKYRNDNNSLTEELRIVGERITEANRLMTAINAKKVAVHAPAQIAISMAKPLGLVNIGDATDTTRLDEDAKQQAISNLFRLPGNAIDAGVFVEANNRANRRQTIDAAYHSAVIPVDIGNKREVVERLVEPDSKSVKLKLHHAAGEDLTKPLDGSRVRGNRSNALSTIPGDTALEWAASMYAIVNAENSKDLLTFRAANLSSDRMEALVLYCAYKERKFAVLPASQTPDISDRQLDVFEKHWKKSHPEDRSMREERSHKIKVDSVPRLR